MTEKEKQEYYASIEKFKGRGNDVVIIPYKAWNILSSETPSTLHYCIADEFIQMIKIGKYYLFSDV